MIVYDSANSQDCWRCRGEPLHHIRGGRYICRGQSALDVVISRRETSSAIIFGAPKPRAFHHPTYSTYVCTYLPLLWLPRCISVASRTANLPGTGTFAFSPGALHTPIIAAGEGWGYWPSLTSSICMCLHFVPINRKKKKRGSGGATN